MNQTRPNRDSHVWMPFTQMNTAPEPPVVRRGNGVMLELEDGRAVMDCISSWWVTLHGHGEPRIATAIGSQARQLEQVIAAGLTHRPAELLAQRLVERLPRSLNRVFYSDNGSTAVEVALKMAFQFWKNRGVNHRTRFLSFEGAYHGDTLGAMSVGSRSVFTSAFEGLLFEVDFVPFAATHAGDVMAEEKESRSLEHLENLLREKGDRYGAMIMEPLVQGAGGMRMCRGPYLCKLETLLREHGILTIGDEVMVGFGRTGEWFASDRARTAPDIVCLADRWIPAPGGDCLQRRNLSGLLRRGPAPGPVPRAFLHRQPPGVRSCARIPAAAGREGGALPANGRLAPAGDGGTGRKSPAAAFQGLRNHCRRGSCDGLRGGLSPPRRTAAQKALPGKGVSAATNRKRDLHPAPLLHRTGAIEGCLRVHSRGCRGTVKLDLENWRAPVRLPLGDDHRETQDQGSISARARIPPTAERGLAGERGLDRLEGLRIAVENFQALKKPHPRQ